MDILSIFRARDESNVYVYVYVSGSTAVTHSLASYNENKVSKSHICRIGSNWFKIYLCVLKTKFAADAGRFPMFIYILKVLSAHCLYLTVCVCVCVCLGLIGTNNFLNCSPRGQLALTFH